MDGRVIEVKANGLRNSDEIDVSAAATAGRTIDVVIAEYANCLRALTWPDQATEIDKMLGGFIRAVRAEFPSFNPQETLRLVEANHSPLVQRLAADEIDSLDAAMIFVLFGSPARAAEAKNWLVPTDKSTVAVWLADHPGFNTVVKLLRIAPTAAVEPYGDVTDSLAFGFTPLEEVLNDAHCRKFSSEKNCFRPCCSRSVARGVFR